MYTRALGMYVIITRVDRQHGFPIQIRFATGKVFSVCRARFYLFLYIENAFFCSFLLPDYPLNESRRSQNKRPYHVFGISSNAFECC